VATEPAIFRLRIDADARLAAAAGGAARYLADAAGLESDASVQLQSTVVRACIESFEQLKDSRTEDSRIKELPARLEVTLMGFPDRIEVALSSRGKFAPAFGLDAIAGFARPASPEEGAPSVLEGVDRVQYETRDGASVTRLTKYFRQLMPRV